MSGSDVGTDLGSWDGLASAAAQTRAIEGVPETIVQLLRFHLDGAPYAVPVSEVHEIVRMRAITPVPRTPAEIRGVISLRGSIVQVVDLRSRLRLPLAEPSRESRVIVVQNPSGGLTGLLVDGVSDVLRVPECDLIDAAAGEGIAVEALCPAEDGFVTVVDLERLLDLDHAL